MSFNRRPVTVRFNLNEQRDLATLMDFLKVRDEGAALKVCFYQMISSLKEIQKKLKEAEDRGNQNTSESADSDASGADNDSGAENAGDISDSESAPG